MASKLHSLSHLEYYYYSAMQMTTRMMTFSCTSRFVVLVTSASEDESKGRQSQQCFQRHTAPTVLVNADEACAQENCFRTHGLTPGLSKVLHLHEFLRCFLPQVLWEKSHLLFF